MITALLIGAGALWLISRKNKGTAGIGYTTPTLGRKRMQTYFMSDHDIRPGEVEVDLTDTKKDYVYVVFRNVYKPSTYWWVHKNDLRYLSELCDNWDVEFSAWNGNVYLPTLHKKIVMDFDTETERLPYISGIGTVRRSKRRIWSEVEQAQKYGIDLTDPDAWKNHTDTLSWMAQRKIKDGTSDKPIEQRYFNQLQRAYKSIAGTNLPYTENVVRNENDDVILIYRDYQLDKLPAKAAEYMYDQAIENMHNDPEMSAYWATIAMIANGQLKFVWGNTKDNVHRGAEKLVFGKSAPEERKRRISYLASPAKGGRYPEEYAHQLWERTGADTDDQAITNGVLAAIREIDTKGLAAEYCKREYLQAFQVQEPLLYQDVPF